MCGVAYVADIVFDCDRAASLARFWATVLDGYEIAPYDEAEMERLRSLGIDEVENDPTVLVQPNAGTGLRFWFQKVPESKVAKNRVHLDLRCVDLEEEVRRLEGAGARELYRVGSRVTLADPERNEFCLEPA